MVKFGGLLHPSRNNRRCEAGAVVLYAVATPVPPHAPTGRWPLFLVIALNITSPTTALAYALGHVRACILERDSINEIEI